MRFRRRRASSVHGVEFCERCVQVCTPECRSQSRLDQAHTWAAAYQPYAVIR